MFDIGRSILGKKDTAHATPIACLTSAVLILPVFGITPSAGVTLGAQATYLGRFGSPSNTSLSEASISASYSTKGQTYVLLRPIIYFPGDRFLVRGDFRYWTLTQTTYGLGPQHPYSDADEQQFKLARAWITAFVNVAKHLYVGAGYALDDYFDIRDNIGGSTQPSPFLEYNGGNVVTRSTASGFRAAVLYDSRDNPINAKQGYFVQVAVTPQPTWLGNAENSTQINWDGRTYVHLNKSRHTILAFWTLGNFAAGHAPYLNLPAIGWDRDNTSGRGYVQGQIRAPSAVYGEAELRQQITANGLFGFVVFGNLTVAKHPDGGWGPGNPAYGAGFRLKINKNSDQNVRLDIALSPLGPARLFLGASEAF